MAGGWESKKDEEAASDTLQEIEVHLIAFPFPCS